MAKKLMPALCALAMSRVAVLRARPSSPGRRAAPAAGPGGCAATPVDQVLGVPQVVVRADQRAGQPVRRRTPTTPSPTPSHPSHPSTDARRTRPRHAQPGRQPARRRAAAITHPRRPPAVPHRSATAATASLDAASTGARAPGTPAGPSASLYERRRRAPERRHVRHLVVGRARQRRHRRVAAACRMCSAEVRSPTVRRRHAEMLGARTPKRSSKKRSCDVWSNTCDATWPPRAERRQHQHRHPEPEPDRPADAVRVGRQRPTPPDTRPPSPPAPPAAARGRRSRRSRRTCGTGRSWTTPPGWPPARRAPGSCRTRRAPAARTGARRSRPAAAASSPPAADPDAMSATKSSGYVRQERLLVQRRLTGSRTGRSTGGWRRSSTARAARRTPARRSSPPGCTPSSSPRRPRAPRASCPSARCTPRRATSSSRAPARRHARSGRASPTAPSTGSGASARAPSSDSCRRS